MKNSNIKIITNNHVYKIGTDITFKIKLQKDISDYNYLKFHIYKISKESEHNNIIAKLSTPLTKKQNGIYEFMLDSKIINQGLFFIGEIKLLQQDTWDDTFPLKFKSYKSEQIAGNYFKIQKELNNNYSYQNLLDEIKNINLIRHKKFISEIDDTTTIDTSYSVYVVSKNIYKTKTLTCNNFEITPFTKLCNSANITEYLN